MKRLLLILFFMNESVCDSFNAHMQRAYTLLIHNEFEASLTLYQELLQHLPDHSLVNYNIAFLLRNMDRPQEAIEYYRKALTNYPSDEYQPRLGLAKSLLATGNFREGWREFEWRYVDPEGHIRNRVYNLKPENFKNKIVFIRAEWGLGDSMQWVRFVKLVKEQQPKMIFVQTFKPLVPFFSRCDFIDGVIEKGLEPLQYDIEVPLMSLPYIFGITLDTLPTDIPYLKADEQLVELWRERLAHDTNVRVGLCWHTKPIHIEDYTYTKRTIPLKTFAPLADIDGVTFYSLQKIYGEDELNTLPDGFIVNSFGPDFDERHGPFMDTAAVIENLDVVITADTSIVHLAGALGKPVWVLLPYCAEWRWLQQRSDTPWYPNNMRLFRCKEVQGWEHLMHEVKEELAYCVYRKKISGMLPTHNMNLK